jgi:DNA-binding MarR family transcriptional regulator
MKVSNEIKYRESFEFLNTLSPSAGFIVAAIHLGKLLQSIGDNAVYSPLGIGRDEHNVLLLLDRHGARKPMDLVAASLLQPAKVTRALDKLENLGAVTRHQDPSDRRSVILELTDTGREMTTAANKNFVAAGERLGMALGTDHITALNGTIQEIVLFLVKYRFDADSDLQPMTLSGGTDQPHFKEGRK